MRVGLIDGYVGATLSGATECRRSFIPPGHGEGRHGFQVASSILSHCPVARLVVAEVFDRRARVDAACVVEALKWLADQGVQIINMSIGTRSEHHEIARLCQDLFAAGVTLVASTPVRGVATFPARLSEVISASGDARCSVGEISSNISPATDFGAHPFFIPGDPESGGGASVAAGRVTGMLAELKRSGIPAGSLRSNLERLAKYRGPELRRA